ncbi:MAG: EAL domain-containing protein [Rhodospirillaceae bacterium]
MLVAEDIGLIGPIGDFVLVEACRQAAIWNRHTDYPIHVGVNVSAHQMKQGNLEAKVKLSLEETGLDPRLLELEMTESAMLDDSGATATALEELRRLGISVAIDDFGTGYSSLSYLTSFPLDTLKVNRAFVMNLPDDRDAVAIARAIVGMAKSLELHIVAEGIETDNQAAFLHALGCHTAQGYRYSKPLGDDAFLDYLGGRVVQLEMAR